MPFKNTIGPNKKKTLRAIYELKGDSLRICYHLDGKPRPKKFETEPKTSIYLVNYQRNKDEKSHRSFRMTGV